MQGTTKSSAVWNLDPKNMFEIKINKHTCTLFTLLNMYMYIHVHVARISILNRTAISSSPFL